MIIACASAGRGGNVIVLRDQWPKEWADRTYLVVPEKDKESYANDWHQIVTHPNLNRLSPTRDWINDYFYPNYVLHLDDDLTFFTKNPEMHRSSPEDIAAELTWFEERMKEGIVYVGMWYRFMCQDRLDISNFPPGMSGFFSVNTKELRNWGFKFSQTDLMQGLNLSVTVACYGYEARMVSRVVYNQPINAPGGSSVYRTGEMYDKAVRDFQSIHGETYINTRRRWCSWPGMEGERDFIRVNWQRIKKNIPQVKRCEI